MAYGLSFAESFFMGGEQPEEIKPSHMPTSVYQAIISLSKEAQLEIAREVLGSNNPEYYIQTESFPFDVIEKIRKTNTCSDLSSPVSIWIDEEGDYRVDVWD